MILQHSFEINQHLLRHGDDLYRENYKNGSMEMGKRELVHYAIDKLGIEFKEFLAPDRYRAAIFACTEDQWIGFRNSIRDLLHDKLPLDIYRQVGELFMQFEIGKNNLDGNTQT